jgi:hypothetical protein
LFEPERTSILHARQRRTFGTVDPAISWWHFFVFLSQIVFLKTFQIAKKIQAQGSDLQHFSLLLAFWQDQFWQICFQVTGQ